MYISLTVGITGCYNVYIILLLLSFLEKKLTLLYYSKLRRHFHSCRCTHQVEQCLHNHKSLSTPTHRCLSTNLWLCTHAFNVHSLIPDNAHQRRPYYKQFCQHWFQLCVKNWPVVTSVGRTLYMYTFQFMLTLFTSNPLSSVDNCM